MEMTCKPKNHYRRAVGFLLFVCLFAWLTPKVQARDDIWKFYHVEINLFSFMPDNPLDTYRWCGGGSASPNGTVGLNCYDDVRKFSVDIEPRMKKKRLMVNVTVKPSEADKITPPDSYEIDLSDLKPKGVELARNDNGRVYLVNLTPAVKIIDNTPKRADETAFNIDRWVLNDAMVIFNDNLYVGKMNADGGNLAFIDMPGMGKAEFAVKPFRNAQRLGTLKDGRINIQTEDGTVIDIYNVKNGTYKSQLPGGPYEVWVRWTAPTERSALEPPSEQEWIRTVKQQFGQRGVEPPADKVMHERYQDFIEKKMYLKPLCSGIGSLKN